MYVIQSKNRIIMNAGVMILMKTILMKKVLIKEINYGKYYSRMCLVFIILFL